MLPIISGNKCDIHEKVWQAVEIRSGALPTRQNLAKIEEWTAPGLALNHKRQNGGTWRNQAED